MANGKIIQLKELDDLSTPVYPVTKADAVYLQNGSLLTDYLRGFPQTTIGAANKPIYLNNGVLTAGNEVYSKQEIDNLINNKANLSTLGVLSTYSVSQAWDAVSRNQDGPKVTIPAGTYICVGFTSFYAQGGTFCQSYLYGDGAYVNPWGPSTNGGGDTSKEVWCMGFLQSSSAMSVGQHFYFSTAITAGTYTSKFYCMRIK